LFGFACLIFTEARDIHHHVRKLKNIAKNDSTSLDYQKFVLYLRSFEFDGKISSTKTLDAKSEEEQLVKVLSKIGPVVAIGKPGDNLPELGAKRYYMEDSNWKQKIGEYIKDAKLVIISVAFSEGLWWELLFALSKLSPEKVILLMPLSEYSYKQFGIRLYKETGIKLPKIIQSIPKWEKLIDKYFGNPIENLNIRLKKIKWIKKIGNSLSNFGRIRDIEKFEADQIEQGQIYAKGQEKVDLAIRGYITFNKNKIPHYIPISRSEIPFLRRPFRHSEAAAFQMAFRPIFQRFNCFWVPPKVSIYRVSLLLILIFIIYNVFIEPRI
jgi:hypothetical protein